MNLSAVRAENVYHLHMVPIHTVALLYYTIVDLPYCSILEQQKYFPPKPRTWVTIMVEFF